MSDNERDFGNWSPQQVIELEHYKLPVSTNTVEILEQLLVDAKKGKVDGLALAVLRRDGKYDLVLRGSALDCTNQMGVAGMLAALQKMVLDMHS